MKKQDRIKQADNVVFFPDLEKRLTEKGIDSLQQKKYRDAIRYLEEAKELDPENSDILFGLVISYFEAGSYQNARELAKEMLFKGIGDYMQMVDLYLTILIQLHEYDEIVSVIEALLDEKEVPREKQDHFLTLLQFSKRMAENHISVPSDEELLMMEEKSEQLQELNLFSLQDPKEQLLLISKLSNQNIRPFMKDIKAYLIAENGHPFLKTILINILKEQEYEKEVEVTKLGMKETWVPASLPDMYSQEEMVTIISLLGNEIEHDDPVLFENMKSLIERYFFIAYPFLLEPGSPEAWAAAFHLTALEYHGMDVEKLEIRGRYNASIEDINLAVSKIKEFEEISYPII